MTQKVRIKDIAEKAGVSVGTVDRILHHRPNVSKSAREKVEKVLKEIHYRPNMYASALAYNRSYTFHLIIPWHEQEAYWEEIEEGAMKACDMRRDFHVNVVISYYKRFDVQSFKNTCKEVLDSEPNGVILVPSELEITQPFTDILHEKKIPFILLDSFLPELDPLTFYGQDSFASGYFAAKMLMLIANKEQEIMLMRQTNHGKLSSRQQENREVGFRHYMKEHYPEVAISEMDLPLDHDKDDYNTIMDDYFRSHPKTHHCITMGSRAYLVGQYVSENHLGGIQIMGYDMVAKNAQCLQEGTISFLIAQHAYMQGFSCVDALFKSIVLKLDIEPINYMPIELLSKENVQFYRRKQL
ncbi:MAG: substrate-binding domain-containing protein [Prevotella sp.]|nr:substrate-binding domain-containing protein [Prevotella sp.]MBQ6309142.1 substrate-binding domain-containing protein [Prevotella sp.]